MRSWLTFIFVLSIFMLSCQQRSNQEQLAPPPSEKLQFQTPTYRLDISEYPNFIDDLDFDWMDLAISRQIERYNNRSMSGSIMFGNDTYSLLRIKDSLIFFKGLIDKYRACRVKNFFKLTCRNQLNADIIKNYYVYGPQLQAGDERFGLRENVFFTAYYTPTIEVKDSPQGEYVHPIYARPSSHELLDKTRVEIDFYNAFAGHGLELFYAKDLFELYLLHIQGGGRVVLDTPQGEEAYYISYDGNNKKRLGFISVYMQRKGYIADRSIESQRNYLAAHPEKQEEIYSYCPSYVYFKQTISPPDGSDSVPLTDNRSIATDTDYYRFKGALAFVQAKKPKNQSSKVMRRFSRFFLDQDTGGAINGKARVDLYHGEGKYAENAAYNTAVMGKLNFLMLKPGVNVSKKFNVIASP